MEGWSAVRGFSEMEICMIRKVIFRGRWVSCDGGPSSGKLFGVGVEGGQGCPLYFCFTSPFSPFRVCK